MSVKASLGYSLRSCIKKKLSLVVLYCYCDKIVDKGSLRSMEQEHEAVGREQRVLSAGVQLS